MSKDKFTYKFNNIEEFREFYENRKQQPEDVKWRSSPLQKQGETRPL